MKKNGEIPEVDQLEQLSLDPESNNDALPSTNGVEASTDHATLMEKSGTDSDESDTESQPEKVSAPLELLGEFLLYVRRGEWQDAKKLCEMILIYEPDNPEALEFFPMIEERIKLNEEMVGSEESSSSEEDDDDVEDGVDDDENEDDEDTDEEEDDDDDEKKTNHLRNKLVFPHKDEIWKP